MATTERRLDTDHSAPTDDAGEPLETMAAWCAHHDLIHALLPFECRQSNTFGEFEALAAALEDLQETQATFALGGLETPDGYRAVRYRPTGAGIVTTQLHLLGAWEYLETSSGQRWINPTYIHGHPWQSAQCSTDERLEIAAHAAALGAVTTEMLAPRFGVQTETLTTWFSRQGFDWSGRRRRGLQRLARTLFTALTWSDHSERDLAAPFRQPDGTVRGWIQKYARGNEWTPPADPSRYHGFQKVGGGDAE